MLFTAWLSPLRMINCIYHIFGHLLEDRKLKSVAVIFKEIRRWMAFDQICGGMGFFLGAYLISYLELSLKDFKIGLTRSLY